MAKTRKKGRRSGWFSLVLCGVILYFSVMIISQQVRIHQMHTEQEDAEARLAAARVTHEQLLEEKDNLKHPEYIEKIAREDLGMTRQGELPYRTGHR